MPSRQLLVVIAAIGERIKRLWNGGERAGSSMQFDELKHRSMEIASDPTKTPEMNRHETGRLVEEFMENDEIIFTTPTCDPTGSLGNTLNLDVGTMLTYVSSLTNGSAKEELDAGDLTAQLHLERRNPMKPFLDLLFEGNFPANNSSLCDGNSFNPFCLETCRNRKTTDHLRERENEVYPNC